VSLILDEHREYLQDASRMAAFRAALNARVQPGDVVVDLGAGTGVLGLLACEAGARRVYAIESTGMIEVARRIARASGFADRIVHVNQLSTLAELPERADGLVLDQIGHFGFEAGLFELVADARRFLKPGAWTIPQSVDLCVCPVSDPELRGRVRFWDHPVHGFDFSPARDWAINTGYPRRLEPGHLLGHAAVAVHVAAAEMCSERINMQARLCIEREGTLDGIGGWFRAALAPGIEMTNAPGSIARLERRNIVLPLDPASRVRPGDTVDVRLQALPADLLLTWRGTINTADGAVGFSHSTLGGMLFTRDDLRRLQPDRPPRLTERGRARMTVLQLCDGERPLAEVEREVIARHPTLFHSGAEAAVFVTEVVSRYTE
jgi:protein arginine N-methyltransferase 1